METNPAEAKLVERIAAERQAASKKGRRVRYSDALRSDVLALLRTSGASAEKCARQLGLAKGVVRQWVRSIETEQADSPDAGLRRVEIVAEAPREPRDVELVFPSGARVSLSLVQLRRLLGGQS